jgi:light-regulated signal transduction histidine kinase (bacteriophytochrome)
MTALDVDMNVLVQEALKELASRKPGRQPNVDVAPLPQVHGDGPMLRWVWLALLENAIASTVSSSGAQIEIGATRKANETIYFVKDNGVSFDSEFIDNYVEGFSQLSDADEFPATVGLAAAKHIIGSHGGSIWREEVPNAAATVFFSLPSEDRRR